MDSDHPGVPLGVSALTVPILLAPLAVGVVVSWAMGHLMAHLTVRALATGMDMTSRAGHRRYYRKGVDYRGGYSR